MNTISKILATTIAGTALVSGLTATAAAAAENPSASVALDAVTVAAPNPDSPTGDLTDGEMRAQATVGFNVTNLSRHTLRLKGYLKNDSRDELPPLGTLVKPGETVNLKVVWLWLSFHEVQADFDVIDDAGRVVGAYAAMLQVDSGFTEPVAKGYGWASRGGVAWGDGLDLYYGDAAGTVIDIPAGEGQAQADVLNRICTAGQATCTFTPTSRNDKAWTGEHQIGEAWGNERTTPYTKEFTATKSLELTENVEVSASVKLTIAKIFEASINAKYGRGVKSAETYTDKTTLTVQPGTMTWPVGNFPIITDTGDFTVKLGNTTWHLRGVTFEHPDPTRYATIVWKEAPVGSAPVGLMGDVAQAPAVINTTPDA